MAVSDTGGEQEYLSGVPVWEYCCARSQELTRLAEELNTAEMKRRGRVSQCMPRHMRRRAASHNLRRLPARVRLRARSQTHPKQLEKRVKPKWSVKQNRRKRRYLRNLRLQRMLLQFSDTSIKGGEDQSKSKWLPTHIWHAKRFHMIEQHGWRIPYTPTQKCTRHSYHSVAKNCVAVDTSYLSIFEISSDKTLLTQSLSSFLLPSLDLSSLSPLSTTLYHPGTYPYGAIGPVIIIPQPNSGLSSSVWMVTHPSMRSEVCQLIDGLSGKVDCKDLTPEIGGLQLFGPSSLHSLIAALPPDLTTNDNTTDTPDHWFDGFNYTSPHLPSLLQDISHTPLSRLPTNSILGYTALDPRLSLPHKRLPPPTPSSPTHRTEMMHLLLDLQSKLDHTPSEQEDSTTVQVTPDPPTAPSPLTPEIESVYLSNRQLLSNSQLFSAEHRQQSVANRHSDHIINKHRGRRVPAEDPLTLPFPMDRLPLLLVTTSGEHGPVGSTGGFGAGLLLLLPREWVLTSWVALTYRGGKPVGMKELNRICLERQVACFPADTIDTHSYVMHSFENKKSLEKEFLSKPPDKRLNYGKLGVSTPFHCPWGSLLDGESQLMNTETRIRDSISESERTRTSVHIRLPYYVVRERRVVLSLQQVLYRTHMPYKYIPKPFRLRYPCKKLPPVTDPLSLQQVLLDYPNSLLLISVHTLARGCVESRAALFLPTQQDIRVISTLCKKDDEDRDVSWFPVDNTNSLGVTKLAADRQVVCGVSVQSEEIKTAITTLKRHRKELRNVISDPPPPPPPPSCCLYKPPDSFLRELDMQQLSADARECCGYITSGDYSFCRGYSVGVGCLLTSKLLKLVEVQEKVRLPPILLMRNPSALQLCPVLFTLIVPC